MTDATCKLLAQHFDTAFAAPDGIKKLRELILTLAMQGKLVPQDPNDPPASELLKEIEAEKKRLVKEGRIKSPKPLPPVTDKEKPYELPLGWEWVRFESIVDIGSGVTKGRSLTGRKTMLIPYLRVANVQRGYLDLAEIKEIEIPEKEVEKLRLAKGDLLITEGGDWDKVGRTSIWRSEIPLCVHQNHVFKARKFLDVQSELWLEKYLNSPTARNYFAGASKQTTNLASINKTQLRGCPIPIPPLPEQYRIVTKIDELMSRCDALEKLRTAQNEKRLTVHAAAIQQLLNIAEPAQHQRAQAFLAEHFAELYIVKENVTELRKAILQLAVMGKLAPQDPNEPPASELLKEIETEKKRLVTEGKIKAPKPLPPVSDQEKPYELPLGWVWVRLGELFRVTSGNNLPKDKMQDGNIPVFGGNGITGFHDESNVEKPTIVIGRVGYYCGSIHLTPAKAWITDNAFFTIYDEERLFQDFVIWLLKTINLQVDTSATAQPVISGSKIYPILIPLPPLREQHRIVAKIDQLMALCDTLEQKIAAASQKQAELLDAVMAQSQPVSQSFECVPA